MLHLYETHLFQSWLNFSWEEDQPRVDLEMQKIDHRVSFWEAPFHNFFLLTSDCYALYKTAWAAEIDFDWMKVDRERTGCLLPVEADSWVAFSPYTEFEKISNNLKPEYFKLYLSRITRKRKKLERFSTFVILIFSCPKTWKKIEINFNSCFQKQ